ncbi:MAG TPA: hypothetical protein VE153_22545 [Myxococcus sp.]|nr:hypothetical protein [Myxococcus sp.]
MKVDSHDAPPGSEPVKGAPDGARFQKALQQTQPRRPAVPPGNAGPGRLEPGPLRPAAPTLARAAGPVLATARTALASPENLGRMRQGMHAEAQRLGTVRGEATAQVQERTEHRLGDLVARELSRELRAASPPVSEPRPGAGSPDLGRNPAGTEPSSAEPRVTAEALTGGTGASGAQGEPAPASRAEAALELIERIEVFVKSQRPALSLSLRGTLDATVELERTGPREVALRLQGRKGPVPVEELARLRDALEARGLRLSALRSE